MAGLPHMMTDFKTIKALKEKFYKLNFNFSGLKTKVKKIFKYLDVLQN